MPPPGRAANRIARHVPGVDGFEVPAGHTKAATRGERYGGLDVTLTRANAGTGQWRWRESNLSEGVGTERIDALTWGNAQDDRGLGGPDRARVLTASTPPGDLGVKTRSRHVSRVPLPGAWSYSSRRSLARMVARVRGRVAAVIRVAPTATALSRATAILGAMANG